MSTSARAAAARVDSPTPPTSNTLPTLDWSFSVCVSSWEPPPPFRMDVHDALFFNLVKSLLDHWS